MKKNFIGYRPTWAEINLDNLAFNYNATKQLLPPQAKLMVCVKADAYGHGLIPVSKKLVSCGVDWLGVASIDEGIKLREANITLSILVLGLVLKEDICPLFKYRLTPAVCTKELAVALNKLAQSKGKAINIHIKVDTGMGRIGVLCNDAYSLIKRIDALKHIHIEGVFTHLASADVNNAFTLQQLRMFNNLVSALRKDGMHIPFVHAANSMGVIGYKESHFNMARPGLIVYGLYPKENVCVKLKPVLALKTKVGYVKRVPKGYGISYGSTYITPQDTTIVTLPIGYGDGYPRNLSNLAPVLISGRRFKINGRVCMDQIMVDVHDTKIKTGEEVVLIGRQGKNKITAEELAELSGTIPYEIVCGLGSRIPRLYI